MEKEKRVLFLYLALVFVISAPLEVMWILGGETGANIAPLLMLVPAAVALVLKLVFFRKQKLLGFHAGRPIYYLYCVLIPLGYISLSYLLFWVLSPGTYVGPGILIEATSGQGMPAFMLYLLSVVGAILVAFGEEIGWRGLMYPLMHRQWGRNRALVFSGLVWAMWHFPVLIWADYMSEAAVGYRIAMFTIEVVAITVVVSWLRMKSDSVWPAAIFHGLHNFFDQTIFTPMTGGANKAYFVSETGLVTVLFSLAAAALILAFGKFDKTDVKLTST